ncbi:Fic family protein [Endozoicomonas lisbonensis]|uniref:Fido (Protein-threonine AMPylation protein) n=1 Tax=Endozoicomonas lisbonensis TaxID=3120522 RepID=A0ABV2SBR7_9GAMM
MGPLFESPFPQLEALWRPVLVPVYESSRLERAKGVFRGKGAEECQQGKSLPLPGIEVFLNPLASRRADALVALPAETLPATTLKPAPEAGIKWYQKIPVEERYRLLVDEKLLKTEKGAKAFESREPGCLRGGASMYEFIIEQLPCTRNAGELTRADYLKQLHSKLFDTIRRPSRSSRLGIKLGSKGEFRKKRVFFRVKTNYTRKGLQQAEMFLRSISGQTKGCFHVDEYNTASPMSSRIIRRCKPAASKLYAYLKDEKYTVDFAPVQHKQVEVAIEKVLAEYQDRLTSVTDEKTLFLLLSELASKVDQIHPFEDGNIRVIRGLVDSILMYYGYCPIVWDDPNIIDLYDSGKLSKVMASSVSKTQSFILGLQSGKVVGKGRYKSTAEDHELSRKAFEPEEDESAPPRKKQCQQV